MISIDLFIKLVQQGIALVKERKERRKSFFDNVIAKQHDVFEKMCVQHLETFMKVQDMLMDQDIENAEILKYVEKKILFEGGTINFLKQIVDADRLESEAPRPVAGSIRTDSSDYEHYLALVSECIISPSEPVDLAQEGGAKTVVFYNTLHTLVDLLSEGSSRETVLEGLERVIIRFNNFYAEVQSSFFRLRREYIN
jgi:hypothetical protein